MEVNENSYKILKKINRKTKDVQHKKKTKIQV
jgi:hypothetical protein